MFTEKHIPNRRPGERLVTFVRPHWLHLVRSFLFFFMLLVVLYVSYFLIMNSTPHILENDIIRVILVSAGTLYLLVTFQLLYNRFIDYHLDIWIVTTERIIAIVQKNIFNRTISEHQIELIQDVTANQKGILQTFFNFGDVEIQTASEEQHFHFDDIPDPFEVAKEINKIHAKKV